MQIQMLSLNSKLPCHQPSGNTDDYLKIEERKPNVKYPQAVIQAEVQH